MSQPQQTVRVAEARPVGEPADQLPPAYGQPIQGYPPDGTAVPAYAAPGQPAQTAVVWVEERRLGATEEYLITLLQYSRTVKILAIIDLVFVVINALINPITLVLIAGPLCGVYGATKFNVCLVTTYAVYSGVKAVINILQLILIASGNYIYVSGAAVQITGFAIAIMLLSAAVQVWIAKITFKFRSLVADLTPEKLDELGRAQHNPQSRRMVFA